MFRFKSNIHNEMYLVSRGVRDVSLPPKIDKGDLHLAIHDADHLGVKVFVEHEVEDELYLVIYKEDYILDLFKHFKMVPGTNPLRHWGLGHLLGYGRHEINEFVNRRLNMDRGGDNENK